jgi:preprotein translocase subunit SecG
MESLLVSANIVLAVLLVGTVLLQRSEGGALGLGASQDSFVSSRSAGTFLTKATAIIATLFIITSLSLTILAKKDLSPTSVIDETEENQDDSLPKIPKNEN